MENKHNVRVCFKVPTNSRYQKKKYQETIWNGISQPTQEYSGMLAVKSAVTCQIQRFNLFDAHQH